MSVYQRGTNWCYDFGQRHFATVGPRKTDAINAENVARGRLLDQRLGGEWGLRPSRPKPLSVSQFLAGPYTQRLAGTASAATFATYQIVVAHFSRVMYHSTAIYLQHVSRDRVRQALEKLQQLPQKSQQRKSRTTY